MTGSHEVRGSIPLGSTKDQLSKKAPAPKKERAFVCALQHCDSHAASGRVKLNPLRPFPIQGDKAVEIENGITESRF